MPRSSQIYELIKNGEDQHLDFKLRITSPEKIARTMVAFANSEGGRIVIGVDDAGDVVGVDVEQEKYMMIQAGKKFCDPPIFVHFVTMEENHLSLLVAEVEASKKEHRALDESGDWNYYVRVKDQTVLVSDADEQSLADKHNLKPIPILIEENQGLVNYLRQNNFITIKEYMKLMGISYGIAKRSLNDLVQSGVLGAEIFHHTLRYYLKRKS